MSGGNKVKITDDYNRGISSSNPLPVSANITMGDVEFSSVRLIDINEDPLDAVYETIYAVKVHVMGDGDKYVRGVSAEGETTTSLEPVLIAGEDNSGNLANLQTNAAKDLKVTLDSESVAVTGTFYPATQPVSATALPLPSGAATSANQTTLIGRLPAVASAADDVANPSISKLGSYNFVYDGSTWDRARGNSVDGLLVNLGSNNDVSISGSVTVDLGVNNDVTVTTQPARDRLTDNVGVALQTDVILSDTTALTPKFAVINISASADIIALVAGKKIRVTNIVLVSAGATTVTFQSGASTSLTGALALTEFSGFTSGFDPTGHFETASGEKLNIVLGTAVDVDGWIKYVEV